MLFLIDTGSTRSVIDSSLAQRLSLEQTGNVSIRKNYSVEELPTVVAEQIEVGAKVFLNVPLLASDLGPLSQSRDMKFGGILGADILATTYVSLLYTAGNVRFLAHIDDCGIPVKLTKTDIGFFVPVKIGTREFQLLLDSGTNMTAISDASWQALPFYRKPDALIYGIRSAGSLVDSALGYAPTLRIWQNRTQ